MQMYLGIYFCLYTNKDYNIFVILRFQKVTILILHSGRRTAEKCKGRGLKLINTFKHEFMDVISVVSVAGVGGKKEVKKLFRFFHNMGDSSTLHPLS